MVAALVAPSDGKPATNYLDILNRMKRIVGVESDTALAKAMGLRQSSISSAKAREQVPPTWAVQLATDYGVSLDWIMFGFEPGSKECNKEERPSLPKETLPPPPEQQKSSAIRVPQKDYDISELVAKTIKVLQSDSIFRTALTSNIEAFHHGVNLEDRINNLEKRMHEQMAGAISGIQDQLNDIAKTNETLRQENQDLRTELDRRDRADDAFGDTG